MVNVIDNIELLPPLLAAPRAIALVAVPWSPWHAWSRRVLDALESSRALWLPGGQVQFFVLWPERDEKLNPWYEELCQAHYPRFELHGHGYAPLWWLAEGQIMDCLTKPYEMSLEDLQQRSRRAFENNRATASLPRREHA